MKKSIMFILSILYLTGNVFGQTGFQAIENSGKITITGYTGSAKDVVIPETVNGMPIVAIGDEAFRGKGLTSITIPDSVTSIGTNVFVGNDQLLSITIGSNVTLVVNTDNRTYSFGYGFDRAYNNRSKPAGTYRRGSKLNNTDGYIWGIVNGDFLYMGTTVTGYIGSGTTVTIPAAINGVPITAIGYEAFYNKRLTSVTIPDSVTSIGYDAFRNNQLTTITLPSNITFIGDEAFGQNKLTSITIPNSVTTIDNNAFKDNQLTTASIGNSVTSIGGSAFGNNQLATVTIGNSVTSIGEYAFYNNRLTSVTIPNSVTSIGDYAFSNNPLTNVTIGPNVQMGGGGYSGSDAFPRSFLSAYNGVAGTYTRPSTDNNTWAKGVFTF